MEDEIKTRLRWVTLYLETEDAGLVCRKCGISRPTLRQWVRLYQKDGTEGLCPFDGRSCVLDGLPESKPARCRISSRCRRHLPRRFPCWPDYTPILSVIPPALSLPPRTLFPPRPPWIYPSPVSVSWLRTRSLSTSAACCFYPGAVRSSSAVDARVFRFWIVRARSRSGRHQAECLWMIALVSRNSLKAISPHSRPFPDIL